MRLARLSGPSRHFCNLLFTGGFMRLRVVLALGFALLVSACATTPPHNVSVQNIRALKLESVVVEGGANVRSWPAQEDAAINKQLLDAAGAERLKSEPATAFPQLAPHFTAALQAKFEPQIRNQLGFTLSGARPVKVVVRVTQFDVPSMARRILVDSTSKLAAQIALVDAKTGEVIVAYPGPLHTQKVIGGLAAPIFQSIAAVDDADVIVRSYVTRYHEWLVAN